MSDLFWRFVGQFCEDRSKIVCRGEADGLTDLVNGHIGVSQKLESVLDHNIVLVIYGTDTGAPFERFKKR